MANANDVKMVPLKVKQISRILGQFDPAKIIGYGDNYHVFAGLLEPKLRTCATAADVFKVMTLFFGKGIGGGPYVISKECADAVWSVIQ